ncbi:hypothetical protein Tco_1499164 [Tanacetum coccineum]
MPMTWSPDVTLVSVKEKFRNVMKCLKIPSKFAKSLTCGASISWGRSRLQTPASAPVKAVEQSCVTCGGGHSYQNCPATNSNMYHDNIQEYVSQAAAANFNQANSGYRPPMVSNQIRPPGFPPVQNPHANNQNNFNRGNNFNQNRGNNFNQGQIYRPPVNQPVAHQPVAHQGPAPSHSLVIQSCCCSVVTPVPKASIFHFHQEELMKAQRKKLTDQIEKILMKSLEDLSVILNKLPRNLETLPISDSHVNLRGLLHDNEIGRSWCEALFSCLILLWNNLSLPELTPTCHALIDVYEGEITLRVGKEAITFIWYQTSRTLADSLPYDGTNWPPHLEYAIFGRWDDKLLSLIAKRLKRWEKAALLKESLMKPPEKNNSRCPSWTKYARMTSQENEYTVSRWLLGISDPIDQKS